MNGSKMVIKRYTLSIEKEEMDAIFPVPKKAMLINIKKKLAIRTSED
jgi:hypothetical protein